MSLGKEIEVRVEIVKVVPSLMDRISAEWRIKGDVRVEDILLCFGNLPPLFRIKGRVALFLQNQYLLKKGWEKGMPLKYMMRIFIERLWLKWRHSEVHSIVVQTPTMQAAVKECLGRNAQIMPFVEGLDGFHRRIASNYSRDGREFLYVASGEPHKNHENLLQAWRYLAEEGIRPRLVLTVDRRAHPQLCAFIETVKREDALDLYIVGEIGSDELMEIYGRAAALIYPSLMESFGLPLVEARRSGLPIIAPELDYVRDVVDPEETFNPHSPRSIARAVKRFLGVQEDGISLVDASEFLQQLIIKVGTT